MKIEDIKPNPYNPRHIKDDRFKKLCESIKKFPKMMELRPMVVDNDGVILGGNMRYNALRELGYAEIPDEWVKRADDLTEEEKKQFIVKDNMPFGEWNFDELANQFEVDDLLEWGFDEKDLKIEMPAEEDDVPEVPEKATSKLGEIYQLGNHRLMCGDSTKAEDVEKLMDGQKADMVFTDPPYNVDYTGGMGTHEKNEREGILNDKMSNEDFYNFLYDSLSAVMRYVNGGVYVCMSSSELHTLKKAFEQAGGHWQSYIIWVKDRFTLSRADYQHLYEPILYGWNKNTKNHHFIGYRDNPNVWENLDKINTKFADGYTTIKFQGFEVKIKGKAEGEVKRRKQKVDIWRYNKPDKSEEHPTMKPVKLCAYAIQNSSPVKGSVIDIFAGSGSTLMAAEKTGRKCYAMELDPKYIDVIIKRWENFTGQKAEKIDG